MTEIVVFTKLDAKVLRNKRLKLGYDRRAPVAINPDLTKVVNVPTIFWKLKDGEIIEMNPYEKRTRLYEAKHSPIDTKISDVLYPLSQKTKMEYIQAALALAFVAILVLSIYGVAHV